MLPVLFSALTFPLPQASTMAPKTDALYEFIYWASVISFVPTIAAMVYFGWKYRASKNKAPVPYIHGHPIFEWSVSTILSILFVTIFVWGLVGFNEIHNIPDNAYEISVIGQQWMWTFQYANGKTTTSDLYVPVNTPIKLILSSRDVIHDFFVPNFRLKQDAVPGMYTTLWFQATELGENQIFCAQYCGTAHSNMIGKVIVLSPEQFHAWLQGGDPNKVNVVDLGHNLFMKRNCIACHSIDKTSTLVKPGPNLLGLFNSHVKLSDGSEVIADENYIRESINKPSAKVVRGYQAIMPTYRGLLSEEETNELLAYIKSLKE